MEKKISLEQLKNSPNVAELLDPKDLALIGDQVVNGYNIDEDSRSEWKSTIEKAMDIAKQIMEPKSFPWPGAANIKMPIITKACIEYASRTLPELIQNDKIVKGIVVGQDPEGLKQLRCDRVSRYMSYQLLTKSPDWEEGTDSLLQTLPVLGTVFKKTYYSETEKRCKSEMCVPENIVVNYNTQSLETSRRVTHTLVMYSNDILERQRRGLYLDIPITELTSSDRAYTDDEDFPINILEQHCYLDLDDDDYKEPYIVLVHKESRKVLRIVSRFKNIEEKNGKVVRIDADQYFTDYHFIRSPDGGFYSMGFGSLLLPINTTINTITNQLLDSGTLSNTQGGFLGRGLRIKNGEVKVKMGEWKVLDAASGTSIKENIFPLPVREPSSTLLQLLQLMLQEAKDLSSTTDVLLGKQPAQNVASGTISQLVDQGTKVFAAINKRVYRGQKKEYQKIYDLNFKYLSNEEYRNVLDDPEADVKKDFEPESMDIYPISDPTLSSEQQRISRASMIQQLPTVDRRAADEMVLEAMQVEDSVKKKLLPEPDPDAPPPPEVQKIMAEIQQIQAEVAKISAEATLSAEKVGIEQIKTQVDAKESEARIQEAAARVWKMQEDARHNRIKDQIQMAKMQYEGALKDANLMSSVNNDNHDKMVEQARVMQDNKKIDIDAMLRAKELEIKEKQVKSKGESQSSSTKKPSDEDILFTARLKGMSVKKVKELLNAN